MGFNGGGGGALPPHEHTNIANDGGPLDMNNATVGSLNAGSVVYSDGAALQELTIGAANTVLESSGAVPQWVVAGGGATLVRTVAETSVMFSSSSTSMVTITGMTVTMSASTGYAVCSFDTFWQTTGGRVLQIFDFSTDGPTTERRMWGSVYNQKRHYSVTVLSATLGSQTVDVQAKQDSSGTWSFAADTEGPSCLSVLEIS